MRVLVTAGPTREYLDAVRYLSNASSGKMGYAIVEALLEAGWEAELVSGPVDLRPPPGCEFHAVVTTGEMREACVRLFPGCDGVIAAAAVCDYKPSGRAGRGTASARRRPAARRVPQPSIHCEMRCRR